MQVVELDKKNSLNEEILNNIWVDFNIEVGKENPFSQLGFLYYDQITDTLYVWDSFWIKKIDLKTKKIIIIAGNGIDGYIDGDSDDSRIGKVNGMAIRRKDDLEEFYFTDESNKAIRKIHKGVVSTISGGGDHGYGIGFTYSWMFPYGMLYDDKEDKLVVCDGIAHRIKTIDPIGKNNPAKSDEEKQKKTRSRSYEYLGTWWIYC